MVGRKVPALFSVVRSYGVVKKRFVSRCEALAEQDATGGTL